MWAGCVGLTLLLSAPFGVGQDGNTGKEKYSTRAVEVSKADKGTATKESTTASDQFEYTTSWIGNTFGGNDPNPANQTLYHVTFLAACALPLAHRNSMRCIFFSFAPKNGA